MTLTTTNQKLAKLVSKVMQISEQLRNFKYFASDRTIIVITVDIFTHKTAVEIHIVIFDARTTSSTAVKLESPFERIILKNL